MHVIEGILDYMYHWDGLPGLISKQVFNSDVNPSTNGGGISKTKTGPRCPQWPVKGGLIRTQIGSASPVIAWRSFENDLWLTEVSDRHFKSLLIYVLCVGWGVLLTFHDPSISLRSTNPNCNPNLNPSHNSKP